MGLFESLKAVSIVNKKHIGDLKKLPLNDVVSYKISVLSDGVVDLINYQNTDLLACL